MDIINKIKKIHKKIKNVIDSKTLNKIISKINKDEMFEFSRNTTYSKEQKPCEHV